MRTLRMADDDSAGSRQRERQRRPFLRAAILAAGLAGASALLLYTDTGREAPAQPAGPDSGMVLGEPVAETRPAPARERVAPPAPVQAESRAQGDGGTAPVRPAIESLRSEFPYSSLDCRFIDSGQAGDRASMDLMRLPEEPPLADNLTMPSPSPSLTQTSRSRLEESFRIKDAWAVLDYVQYLESLNLESPPFTLYDEYRDAWLEGGPNAPLPDPECMDRVGRAVALLRTARHYLAVLVGQDPSLAPQVLESLPENARKIVLSGAVGASLADPERPTIDGLFDFLPPEEKLRLIEMYDSALPEEERLAIMAIEISRELPDSELWRLFSERRNRFNEYSKGRERLSREALPGQE